MKDTVYTFNITNYNMISTQGWMWFKPVSWAIRYTQLIKLVYIQVFAENMYGSQV